MENQNKEINKPNKIVVCNQNELNISGISKVISSTDKNISVVINGKTLSIDGENLAVNELNVQSGNLAATGKILQIKWTNEKQKNGLFKRIFG